MNKRNVALFARAKELSFENAEQWIEDAKLLIENKSYGHARALLSFAHEEIAKGVVSWIASKKLWPIDSKPIKDMFKSHEAKNIAVLGIICAILQPRATDA